MPIRSPRNLVRTTRPIWRDAVPYGRALIAGRGKVLERREAIRMGIPEDALKPHDPTEPSEAEIRERERAAGRAKADRDFARPMSPPSLETGRERPMRVHT